MADPKHPTRKDWPLFDPLVKPPPSGDLLIINEGGALKICPWYEGALAWGLKPVIPQTVKDRMTAEMLERLK